MFQVLAFGLETHAKGLPAWMAVKDIDHLSTKERRSIVSPSCALAPISATLQLLPRGASQSCTEARLVPCAWQLHHADAQQAAAKASCMKNKKLGATCIGLDNQ